MCNPSVMSVKIKLAINNKNFHNSNRQKALTAGMFEIPQNYQQTHKGLSRQI